MWHDAAASGTPSSSRRERLSGSSLTVASTPRSARYPTQPRQQPQPGSRHTSIVSPPSAFEVAVPPPGRATSVTAESPAPLPHAASPTATIPPNAARRSVRRSRIETSGLALDLSTLGKLPHSVAYCSERSVETSAVEPAARQGAPRPPDPAPCRQGQSTSVRPEDHRPAPVQRRSRPDLAIRSAIGISYRQSQFIGRSGIPDGSGAVSC